MKRPNKEKKCPEAGWQVVPVRDRKQQQMAGERAEAGVGEEKAENEKK